MARLKKFDLGAYAKRKLKPPFLISIRTQLTALVCIVALLSLIILAVITGVYFTTSFKSLRAERLYVASQLKASQIDQSLYYLYYQCYYLSTRDILQNALTQYLAGNTTTENWADAVTTLDKFLGSSNLFSLARVYDSSFQDVLNASNNGSGNLIPENVLTQLFPLSTNVSLPSSLEVNGMLTDPVLNGTGYLMSMSLPIFANPSIILSTSKVYGYITVVISAEGLKSVFNDTTALEDSSVILVSTVYDNRGLAGYHLVFPPYGMMPEVINDRYSIDNDSFLMDAIKESKGGSIKSTHFLYSKAVAIGYSPCSSDLVQWIAIITQPESKFLYPSTRLARIIVGTCVAIAVVTCAVTFPLSHWAVQPIVRLQKATEIITAGRGLRSDNSSTLYSHKRSSTAESFSSALRAGSIRRSGSVARSSKSKYIPENAKEASNRNDFEEMQPDGIDNNGDAELQKVHSPTPGSLFSEQRSARSDRYITSTNLIEARVPTYNRLFSDELSELTETFNTMTDELDRHYALLEDRVRARTRQLEAAKIEAEGANEAKTVFIANISHELRTPLNGILGMTAIAMAENDMQKVKSSLKLIFRSGELLLHIMTELLTFSKNVLKRTKLEERDFTIHEIALQVESIFGKLAKDQHVNLTISIVPNVLRTMVLWGDSNRIVQIVMNLVSNALKFTPVDGRVNVKFTLLGEYDESKTSSECFDRAAVVPIQEPEKESLTLSPTEKREIKDITESASSSNATWPPSPSTSEASNESKAETTSGKLTESSEEDEKEMKQDYRDEEAEDEKADGEGGQQENQVGDQEEISETNDTSDETQGREGKENENDDATSVASENASSYDDAIFHSRLCKGNTGEKEDGRPLEHPKRLAISMEVQDTGPGIEPALHESVFEPFVQGDQTLSRQYGGTGLGLSICRQLAAMMHGTMSLDSQVGVGSKFTFTVPLTQTKELYFEPDENPFEDEFNPDSKKNRKVKFKVSKNSKRKQSHSSSSGQNSSGGTPTVSESEVSVGSVRVDRPFLQSTGTALSSRSVTTTSVANKCKVLVAEDNNVNQEVIKRMLNLEGLDDVDLACDGQDAFDKVKAREEAGKFYDLIFMDVQMPRVDGLSATRMIRNELNYTHPIVALTAYADDRNIKECIDAGMNGFLAKPIRRPKIKEILGEYCPTYFKAVSEKEDKK
ncbi:LAQU0S19e00694g1_1 [Lachancea quebecensis]|uniref:histidine kinase n=1 Tax=Lachancea quebecensis TaxID=1654605 RepID=A0A0P1KXI5_9SACH|nr:LAQU0S19e00694g1_1 [Lachancea quebecensis]